jgi:hypothetical protein
VENEQPNAKEKCLQFASFLDYRFNSYKQTVEDAVQLIKSHVEKWGDNWELTKENSRVWRHLNLRLAYEKAMLENEGGEATLAEYAIGQTFGKFIILKVNKSSVTGKTTSLRVFRKATESEITEGSSWRKIIIGSWVIADLDITRYTQDELTTGEATPETLEQVKLITEHMKPKKKAPSLLNPTLEDAKALSQVWGNVGGDVLEMTSERYTLNSKGSYAKYETVECSADWKMSRQGYYGRTERKEPAFKVRFACVTIDYRSCWVPIVLTDKPVKALPAIEAVETPELVKQGV